jgi:hypothetical protein
MKQEIIAILDHAKLLVQQHAPAELLTEAIPFGIVCLLAGIGISVFGAKLGRFAMTCGFVLLGGFVGSVFARETGFATSVCGLLGALMVGIIGYHTFRLWVGVLVAGVLSTVVLGVFSYQRVLPHVGAFEQAGMVAMAPGDVFTIPTPDQQQAYLQRTPKEWVSELWSFVTANDESAQRNGRALGLGAMVTGLCLGVLAVRWAMIISTALVGTALVTTSLATLMTHSVPGSYEAFGRNPNLVGVGMGAFLVSSLILQTLLTRKAPSGKSEGKGKS